MPYALKNRCVIRADTGTIVKCHPTRARALKHLAALQINVPEVKADAERTPMTRAEAARHASLVRWKKESALAPQTGGMSNPKIRARVAEILAEKANKGKKKAKGKGKKGPDPAKAKAAAERKAKAAAAKQEREKAKLARDVERTAKQAAREQTRKQKVVERATAAQAKQQERQKKLKAAAAKQKSKAKASASAAKEKAKIGQAKRSQAQQHKTRVLAEKIKRGEKLSASDQVDAEDAGLIKAGKAIDMPQTIEIPDDNAANYTFSIKAGARHSRTDMQHIQAIHDSAVACGADCATDDGEDSSDEGELIDAGKAIKGIMDDPGYYAQHECGDIMQASNALSTMAMLIQSELAEEDEDTAHITMLCDAAHTLVGFISSELDELEQAAKDDAEESATIGHEPMKALRAIAILERGTVGDLEYVEQWMNEQIGPALKAIEKREDVNPKAGISKYGAVTFADAKNKKYPIDTADHVRAAWNYIAKEANAAKYDPDEVAQIKAKIIAAWKKLIDKAGPPSAEKAVDDAWLHMAGGSVKAFEDDTIKGLAILYGTKATPDLEKDYLDKDTDLWLDKWGWPRPITYHHGIDRGTHDDPIVGHWTKAVVTDEGVWLEGQLDRAHRYYKAVKELARRGYLKISSDSGPQWVIREPQSNGANYIKRWPLVTASVTVTPMEPRMLPVEVKAYLAELGYETIDADAQVIDPDAARSDATKATDEERVRAILLELELLELELETA